MRKLTIKSGFQINHGQSLEGQIMAKAQHSPQEVIDYLDALPAHFQEHIHDKGNFLNHLYQSALKSLSGKKPQ